MICTHQDWKCNISQLISMYFSLESAAYLFAGTSEVHWHVGEWRAEQQARCRHTLWCHRSPGSLSLRLSPWQLPGDRRPVNDALIFCAVVAWITDAPGRWARSLSLEKEPPIAPSAQSSGVLCPQSTAFRRTHCPIYILFSRSNQSIFTAYSWTQLLLHHAGAAESCSLGWCDAHRQIDIKLRY